MLLCEDFVKFDVQTNQNLSRDNSKVSTFLHSDVFTAFWSFPSYLDHYLNAENMKIKLFYHDLGVGQKLTEEK